MKYGILVLLFLSSLACSQSPEHPLPEVRDNGEHVYTWDDVDYRYPMTLTFDGAAWNRTEPLWNKGLVGYQYEHSMRPRKLLYGLTHNENGYTVLIREGNLKDGQWVAHGKERMEFPSGEWHEVDNVQGSRNGILKHYFNEGTLESETTIVNGVEEGLLRKYRPNGTLEVEAIQENGDIEIIRAYDNNGNPLPQTREEIEIWLERGFPLK